MKYARLFRRTGPVPQSEPLDRRQLRNNAGGYVFAIDDWARLDRFLILGSDAPTYYQNAPELTRENAHCVARCYEADPARTVARIVTVSDSGRAPKNDPAIFALAIGAAHPQTPVRQRALAVLPKVCRTSTHLFQFVKAVEGLGRGWGRSLKRAVAAWYDVKPAAHLAYQAIKYRAREGWTHRDLLRLAHPADRDQPARKALYRWILGRAPQDVSEAEALPDLVKAHLMAMEPERPRGELLDLVRRHGLPWEAVPTEATRDPDVWRAMLPTLGLTALIRELGRMTEIGLLAPLAPDVRRVVKRLTDAGELRKARIHPFTLLQAQAVYARGRAVRGARAWTPVSQVIDALNDAFYRAFANVKPTGKRHLVALDVSGSMDTSMIGGVLSAREASAAMAMVTARTEPEHHFVGFTGKVGRGSGSTVLLPLTISPRQRLDAVVRDISNFPYGPTDCALPMLYALEHRLKVDVFQIFTDSETWAGTEHPVAALRRYREATGIAAKLIVVGMTATGFSIADPSDAGMLDVVGFDSAAPAVMADFAAG